MKKIVISLITFFMLNLIAINTVFATTTVDVKLSTNATELKQGDEVVVTLKLDNLNEVKKGINAYKATLVYDKDIFETITQSDFVCQNGWESLKYNPANGEFIAIKKVGSTKAEEVVKITLKVKNNAEATKTVVKIKDITTSEGKGDISLIETDATLNVVEDQITIPTKPSNPGNSSNNGTITNNPPLSGNTTGSLIGNITNPGTNNSQNQAGDSDNTQIEESNKPQKPSTPQEDNKDNDKTIKKTTKTYSWIYILIFVEIIIVIAIYLYRKNKKSIASKKHLTIIIVGLLLAEFIGTTVAFAYSFAQKGELNGDGEINYADASLLELHLINLKKLPDDKLENADMNSDGKITITDLSILIQKLENSLSYDTIITNLEAENYYPNKNQNIKIKFNATVSFGASLEKLVINGNEYEVEKVQNTNSEYTVTLNVKDQAGLQTYQITEAYLDNNKKSKIDYKVSIDVLKEIPTISNYRVEEDKDNSKLIVLFDVIDKDDSLINGSFTVNDEDILLNKTELKKGANRIELEVEDKKEYKASIVLDYDLDSNQLENDENHSNTQSYEKDLQLLIDYNFNISNIKIYKDGKEATTFDNGDEVQIVFDSTNATKHTPSTIKVDGKEYEVKQENNKYVANLGPLDAFGSKTITIDEVVLSNGKKFELDSNNSTTINVIKRKPIISDFSTTEFTEANNIRVMFDLDDKDKAIIEINIILMDAEGNEIDRTKLTSDQLKDKETSAVNVLLNTKMTTKYKVKILKSYNLTGKDEDNVLDYVALEEEVAADPRVVINSIVPNKDYVEKGGILKLTYDLDSNVDEDIIRMLVNSTNCIAVKLDNGNYEVTLEVGNTSGIYPITTTKLYYNDGRVATIDNVVRVDILKDKPSIENFTQTDNIDDKKIVLGFDIKDEENSFISGKAVLMLDGVSKELEVVKGHNELTFNVEPSRSYTLEIKSTYDLDSNSLPSKPEEDNKVIDGVIDRRNIELIADYELNIQNIKTYNEKGETKYFGKSEPIKISFESSNVTNFEPVKAIINGNEYDLTKIDNQYYLTIDSHRTSGVKTARIEKVILSNSRGIIITKNNEIKVTVLKDKPTVEQFGYKENLDGTITATFNVVDLEQTITNGKVVIINRGATVKEQTLTSNQNTISFVPREDESYTVKIIADYDLDMNVLEEDANEYKNITLLEADITLGNRKFEVKDIIRTLLYRQTENGVEEVQNLKESDLANLDNYIIKVRTRDMPAFYTTISGYRIEDNKLKLTLDYDNVVQYTNDNKQDKLEIVYGEMIDGTATNISLESLLREMESNPTGTFTLDRDYDASIIANNSSALVTSTFMGTLNGNGHKIYNLPKPLFDSIESATIENLTLESPELSGPNSRGTIANTATNSTITNVYVKDLILTTGADKSAGIIGEATNVTVEQSSVTNFQITTSRHIRVSAIIGQMDGGSIKNCYVEGTINSIQTKDGNGISGILGHGLGTSPITIENCISKTIFTNNAGPRLNGDIVGIMAIPNSVLKNNVSLSTGQNFHSIYGSQTSTTITNNYELLDSGLTSNASGDKVKQISQDGITAEFFKDSAKFDENIWDLSNVSYTNPPVLKSSKQEIITDKEAPSNNKLYIPDYSRVKGINGYTSSKDILYHNINKLMPYYDAKYLVEDGLKIANDNELNTKIIKHVLPYSNGKLLTYLTSENKDSITKIKVIFDDYTISEYNVTFKELNQNISIYEIENLNIDYAYNKYVIQEDSAIVQTLTDYINGVDYITTLDPLTTAADARHYKDHYNEVMKPYAKTIALQLLQNDSDSVLTINSEILNNRIKQQLIDSGRLNKILYGYNYYYRWYGFEIGGSKVSDILLFEGKMYKDSATLDNLVNETLVGNIGVNNTANFYASNISKYTGSSALPYFLDYIISNIGGYKDVNDWFTEYFGARNILAEFGVDKNPKILYRAWYQLKKNSRMILPVITMPADCAYIISGPAHLQIGPSQLYHKDPSTEAGRNEVRSKVNNHVSLVKKHFNTLAGSFDPGKWNNYCIMVYDCTRIITGYKNTYFPGTNVVMGTSPVYTQGRVGQDYPFFKNFSEVLGLWQPTGSAAGVGNTAGFLWFIARPGLTNFDTWTHEFEHALFDKIMLFQSGTRFKAGLETLTEGNVQQNEIWSENNLIQDVGPYYFNTTFYLNKEGNATQNLTPERIDTREKLENYFKGQQNALDLLDYIEGKAFIKLTPEQQARVATRMNQSGSWSSWGAITAAQAEQMNLTSLESLYDNRIIIRPENAWGVSVRGLKVINSLGSNDYGFESVWVNRWYIGHNDNGIPDAFSAKRNYFEMLGYAGVDGYVTYGRGNTATDLDAIQKITKSVTGTAMNWKEYKMSRYATVEESIKNNKYIDVDYMIEKFYQALSTDTNRNATQRTTLRKLYYHYLKSITNDFVDDPLGTTIETKHIKTAEELVQKINEEPYGYYVLDNDIDFSNMTTNVTATFMGKLDGNGHKIIGNTLPIFQKIRYGSVTNLVLENTNIPKNLANVGALAARTEVSELINISAKNIQMNFGGRNDLGLIGGQNSTVTYKDLKAEPYKVTITTASEFSKINDDLGGIYVIGNDIDFTDYTGTDSVITGTFNGKIDGQGHTLSNLTNLSLFNVFNGTVENLSIKNFSNIRSNTSDYANAFAKQTNGATLRNMRFEKIILAGRHNVAVISGQDKSNSTFENILVKDANVNATGVYASTFIGRKYSGSIKNVFVQGILEVKTTENGGIVGAMQEGGTIENVVSRVNIYKTGNTYSPVANSEFNGGIVGNIYNTPTIKNSIALGRMEGFTDAEGNEKIPYKFTGATATQIKATIKNCYEYAGEQGFSSITEETAASLKEATELEIHTKSFYQDILNFDENIWNLDIINEKGYPELKPIK